MQIAIIGAGSVGRALATGWRKASHEVTLGVRDPTGPGASELKQQGFTIAAPKDPAARSEAGPLAWARSPERMAMVWIKLALAKKLGRNFGFALLRKG